MTDPDKYLIQFLTSSGWQTDRSLESEGLAVAHFYEIGRVNIWRGHVRILHGDRVVKSTLHPKSQGQS